MRTKLAIIVAALGFSAMMLHAQAPGQVVVQSAAPVPTNAAAAPVPAPAAAANNAATAALLQSLQQLKAANDELLSKQAATLQQLEEVEKAAEQIKIYTKRS